MREGKLNKYTVGWNSYVLRSDYGFWVIVNDKIGAQGILKQYIKNSL